MPMGIGLGIGVTRGGGVGWWQSGSALDLYFANSLGFNSIDRSKTTPDSILTYTNPSAKMVYGSDGVLRYAPHNFYTQSADFSSADWAITGRFTASTNATTAPDGSLTADLLTAVSGSSVTRFITQTPEPLSGASRARIYFKPLNGLTQIIFREATGTGAAQGFTCTGSGTVLAGGAGWSDATITYNSSTGWYLCEATHTRNSAFRINFYMVGGGYVSGDPSGYFWSPTGTETAYLWGAHCFRLPCHDTTYIPTTTAAVYSLPIDHNPTTFAPLGVLIEEQRTNLLLRSQEFDNASWTNASGSVSANAATAPDGTTTADLVTIASNGVIRQVVAMSAQSYTHSVYAKKGSVDWLHLQHGASAGGVKYWFNLNTGVIGSKTGAGTHTITSVGNGWYRCVVTYSYDDTLDIVDHGCGTSDGGAQGGTVNLWGAQLEAGAFATSYIPTTNNPLGVTRLADQVSILTSAFGYNTSEGTIFADFIGAPRVVAVSNRIWQCNAAAGPNIADNDGSDNVRTSLATVAFTDTGGTLTVRGLPYKIAYGYKAGDHGSAVNGGAIQSSSNAATIDPQTTIHIGALSGGALALNSTIKRLTYFPTRRSNADLQVLTT